MAKKGGSEFVCQGCGAVYPKWQGKCDACGEWNTIMEEKVGGEGFSNLTPKKKGRMLDFVPLSGSQEALTRLVTGIRELNRVCGGGLVPGSAILVGGDPGIGKSTLLLQACASISNLPSHPECYYISGEEAIDQVRIRAKRLQLEQSPVKLTSATSVKDIITTLEESNAAVVIIDSIQTMYLDEVESTPGSVSQVRACAYELIKLAKKKGFALFLVGHVTKQGAIAGPRVLEHMVDTVLYFEGERGHHFRILRAVKNRYGATDEIGVFEMQDQGLVEVENPSALFLAERQGNIFRLLRFCWNRRVAPGFGRNPGSSQSHGIRQSETCCRRLGFQPSGNGLGCSGSPLRHEFKLAGCLPEYCRRAENF